LDKYFNCKKLQGLLFDPYLKAITIKLFLNSERVRDHTRNKLNLDRGCEFIEIFLRARASSASSGYLVRGFKSKRVEVSLFVLSPEIEDRGEGEVATGRSTKRPSTKSYKDLKITL
jgi:hypothetical protein